jgi:hypothetical protein
MMSETDDDTPPHHDTSKNIGDRVLDAWHRPRFAFLVGTLAGILLIGMIVFAPADAFQQDTAQDIGERAVTHFQNRAPTGLEYSLVSTNRYGDGLYQIKIDVTRGSITSTETVYVTTNGKWLFTKQPEHLQPQLAQ